MNDSDDNYGEHEYSFKDIADWIEENL
jgi:hypothetical protein